MAMAAWAIKQEQETNELGEPKGLDYTAMYKDKENTLKPTGVQTTVENPWLAKMGGKGRTDKAQSPFSGKSPFTQK